MRCTRLIIAILCFTTASVGYLPLSARAELAAASGPVVLVPAHDKNYAEGYYFYLFDRTGSVFQGYLTTNNYYPMSSLDSVVEYWGYKNGALLFREHAEYEDDDLKIDTAAGTVAVGEYNVSFGAKPSMKWQRGENHGSIEFEPLVAPFRFEPPLIKSDQWALSYPVPWGKVKLSVVHGGTPMQFSGYGSLSHYRATEKLTRLFVQWQNLFLLGEGDNGYFFTRMLNEKGDVKVGAVAFREGQSQYLAEAEMKPIRTVIHAQSKHVYPVAFQLSGDLGSGLSGCSLDTVGAVITLSPLDMAGWLLRKVANLMFGNPWSFNKVVHCTATSADGTTVTLKGVLADDILK